MVLPHRRQQFAKYIPWHDWTAKTLAAAINRRTPDGEEPITETGVRLLAHGRRYPSPSELDAIEEIFGFNASILFEAEMLRYRDPEKWPPMQRVVNTNGGRRRQVER